MTHTTTEPGRRRAFGRALADALAVQGMTQTDVAHELGTSQGTVSAWKSGDSIPDHPDIVFRLERALRLPPGHLAQHLGFQPAIITRVPHPVPDAIVSDPLLTERNKRLMMAVYDQLVADRHDKPGRRAKVRT